jgi:hypothetical protein
MPTYGVVMNQGVSMAALGANALMTGYKPGEFLYSCSAIILVNPGAGAAGLYHFPSGDIYGDAGSRGVILSMKDDIAPTEAYVVFGTYDMMRPEKPRDVAVNVPEINALCEWLRGQLGVAPTSSPAITGRAIVRIVAGHTQVSQGPGGATDLEGFAAGAYGDGYKIYWKAGTGPAPAAAPPVVPAPAPVLAPARVVTRARSTTV